MPMRQMRSERSHIKQPNVSCFAFIAPVHFHNALKPQQRRQLGEKEKKSAEERDPGHTEKYSRIGMGTRNILKVI